MVEALLVFAVNTIGVFAFLMLAKRIIGTERCIRFLMRRFKEEARKIEDEQGYVEFLPSTDPPDRGLDERIYKPKGTPAVIHRNVIGRYKKQ